MDREDITPEWWNGWVSACAAIDARDDGFDDLDDKAQEHE